MKLAIIGQPTEMESDIVKGAEQSGDEVCVYAVCDELGGHRGKFIPQEKTNMQEFVSWSILDLVDRARDWGPDLVMVRYPFWIGQTGILDEFRAILRYTPTFVYQTEQGPTREWGMMYSYGWQHIAVNSMADMVSYRVRFPNAQIHYLPFGTREITPDELVLQPQYVSDIVSDGWAHYACQCYGGWKQRSVDVMVRPLVEMDLALYGRIDKKGLPHSWAAMPGLSRKYRGEFAHTDYPKVYASAKVYAGASWNWAHGGYGVRLAKVLSTGIPVVWHKTVWAEEDGLHDGEQLMFSSNPEDTKRVVQQPLDNEDERTKLGQRGRIWVREHWDWWTNLKRVANEIG